MSAVLLDTAMVLLTGTNVLANGDLNAQVGYAGGTVGAIVGEVGAREGATVGLLLGTLEGREVGDLDGVAVGPLLGADVGKRGEHVREGTGWYHCWVHTVGQIGK